MKVGSNIVCHYAGTGKLVQVRSSSRYINRGKDEAYELFALRVLDFLVEEACRQLHSRNR